MGSTDVMVKKQYIDYRHSTSLNDCLADYIKADHDFVDGIRRGVIACKEGRMRPWTAIKKELGIDYGIPV